MPFASSASSASRAPAAGPLASAHQALDAIARADGALRAWAFVADRPALARPADAQGALAGWPLGVKDIIDVAGMPTGCGSPACAATPAAFDASCVALLRTAGAVPVGKTVTTEFAYVTPGPTRNPADLRHTPGGSSSGSAAAVAAGMVPIALGTQTGGSMIRPAAFCGVVGFKPTFGRVGRGGMRVVCESLDTIGWYGASVAHAAAVGQMLLPRGGTQGASTRPPRSLQSLQSLHVAYLPGNPGHVLGAAAEAALVRARGLLAAQGVHAGSVPGPADVPRLLEAHGVLMHYEFARSLLPVVAAAGPLLSRPLLDAVDKGLALSADLYLETRAWQERQRLLWDAWFGGADLVLTSSVLGPAPAGLHHTGDSAFNKAWSLLGWPCLHLPTTRTAAGLPLGVLLVARPGADADLLAWGQAVHAAVDQRPGADQSSNPSME
ncbi:MAG: amidase [Pseudomonadota bacterium]